MKGGKIGLPNGGGRGRATDTCSGGANDKAPHVCTEANGGELLQGRRRRRRKMHAASSRWAVTVVQIQWHKARSCSSGANPVLVGCQRVHLRGVDVLTATTKSSVSHP